MRVDVHAHLWSDAYLDFLGSRGGYEYDSESHRKIGAGSDSEDLAARFALLDEAGVDLQVLSSTPAAPHFADAGDAAEAARLVNDEYAELVRQHPKRFRAFASLPLPHIDPALAELRRALDELGMLGVAVTTSVLGRSIADPLFEPIFAELNARGSILFVHPAGCGAGSPDIVDQGLTWPIGAPMEDTLAATQLIVAGVPARYRDLKIILCHLGGALPLLTGRLDHKLAFAAPDAPEPTSVAARRLYFDTVAYDHVPALEFAAATFGADRLLLGSDYPYQDGALFLRTTGYIRDSGLSQADQEAVLAGNAEALFGPALKGYALR